jgi:hypothetical protein
VRNEPLTRRSERNGIDRSAVKTPETGPAATNAETRGSESVRGGGRAGWGLMGRFGDFIQLQRSLAHCFAKLKCWLKCWHLSGWIFGNPVGLP